MQVGEIKRYKHHKQYPVGILPRETLDVILWRKISKVLILFYLTLDRKKSRI
jgi:hypothetical protein